MALHPRGQVPGRDLGAELAGGLDRADRERTRDELLQVRVSGGRHGSVEVELRAKEGQVLVSIRDDGIGCSAEAKSGLGTRLINLLATQMKGRVARKPLPQGCEVQVSIALDT
ncbi:hypothetical protein ABIB94_008907 [Bradyrhizobium sp. JR7.2]|uniref:ATP-binding protein n=1 Tax=Bradyrhizobium barranii TaxID=2992140 RepID=A0ABY3R0L3_9BRAD|nr:MULTISPECIES: ATP-binding protein [Bradyrhizobium]UFW91814.1 ATP-binding protein [Bradyrhizobium japonicum]WFU00338.1 ATP-binding protein [Bradyrhizobium barranii]